MNFFKTVFSEDLEPSESPAGENSDHGLDLDHSPTSNPEPASGSVWSFGGLIRTLADRSDSVIESYRRDIDELRSGLKKETAVIRTVASRAVNDSLEKGASVAQESLESVGQAIDDIGSSVWKSTAQIISQGREALLAPSDQDESDSNSNQEFGSCSSRNNQRLYSRFEMQLIAVRSDVNTYCSEPEDLSAFENWISEFNCEDKRGEIVCLLRENSSIRDIYEEVVPDKIGDEAFWCRYFYKVHKLEEAEAARAKLMQRAISGEHDEELRWDFDEDDVESDESPLNRNADGNEELVKKNSGDDFVRSTKKDESSSKDSDFSVVSSQPSMAGDEDLGWDEMEDVGSNDETRGEEGGGSTSSRAGLRKRLSAAEEDEDLSWDIEDDVDEPIVR